MNIFPPMVPMNARNLIRSISESCGLSGMIGKKCIVKQWDDTSGKLGVGGELWNASSQSPLIPGDETVILDIEGLTLRCSSSERLLNTPKS
jgi:membrane protein implicated in regulation of membrane protease activity